MLRKRSRDNSSVQNQKDNNNAVSSGATLFANIVHVCGSQISECDHIVYKIMFNTECKIVRNCC